MCVIVLCNNSLCENNLFFCKLSKEQDVLETSKRRLLQTTPQGRHPYTCCHAQCRLTLTVSTPTLTPSTSAVTIKFILVNSSNFCQKLICLTTAQSCRFPTENRIPNRILYQSILHLQNYLFISIDICSGLCSCSTIR